MNAPRPLHAARSFFGVHHVSQWMPMGTDNLYHVLMHGTTTHGLQSLDPARRCEPLAYYSREGPLGQLFAALDPSMARHPIAVIGLGTGSIGVYARPGQAVDFYEIDPLIERTARDARYFTFFRDCLPSTRVLLGDARRSLLDAPDDRYGLLIVDAFSSDVVPVHLITREALSLYLERLVDGGVLAIHMSSRYLNLRDMLGNLARHLGLVCLAQWETSVSPARAAAGHKPSQWLVMAREARDVSRLAQDSRWQRVEGNGGAFWSDDFSDIWSVWAR